MKIALLSDVHANLVALESVLADINSSGGVDVYWFLGDAVGYGPQPFQCLQRLHEVVGQQSWLTGNHDLGVVRIAEGADAYSGEVRDLVGDAGNQVAALVHAQELRTLSMESCYQRMRQAPTWMVPMHSIAVAHGMVFDRPEASSNVTGSTSYLTDVSRAIVAFWNLRQQNGDDSAHLLCVGHTHIQRYIYTENDAAANDAEWHTLDSTSLAPGPHDIRSELVVDIPSFNRGRIVINPGSVGQARGSPPGHPDTRAGYAVLTFHENRGSVSFRRIPYDVAKVQKHMEDDGYDPQLIRRLALGQ